MRLRPGLGRLDQKRRARKPGGKGQDRPGCAPQAGGGRQNSCYAGGAYVPEPSGPDQSASRSAGISVSCDAPFSQLAGAAALSPSPPAFGQDVAGWSVEAPVRSLMKSISICAPNSAFCMNTSMTSRPLAQVSGLRSQKLD